MHDTSSKYRTKPVDEIVGSAMLSAFRDINAGKAWILKRGSIGLRDPIDVAITLAGPRDLSANQVERMVLVLTTPESYWIGHPWGCSFF